MRLRNIGIFIWVSLLLSSLALRLVDRYDLRLLRTTAEVLSEYAVDSLPAIEAIDTPQVAIDTLCAPAQRPALEQVAPNTPATLPHLSAALRQASSQKIRIVHYGDSQIEEDRITSTLRSRLQARYGGCGVGLIPLHQTIPTLSVRQRLYIRGELQTAQSGPKRYLAYGLRSMRLPDGDLRYGPMAQVAEMNNTFVAGSEELLLTVQPLAGSSVHEEVRLLADTAIQFTCQRGRIDSIYLSGKGRVWGLSLESPTGVIVDNIPMRGCIGTIFTHIDSAQLASFYQTENTRLIILQYGGNAIPTNKNESTVRGICYALRDQVRYLKQLAPETDIVFVGPSDMVEISESGTPATNPMVPLMDNTLRALMTRENVPYFSLYAAMGGEGSMIRWQEIGLAGSDGVHFTRKGADKAAGKLCDWLMTIID